MLYDDNDDDDDCLASGLKYSKYSMMAFNKKKKTALLEERKILRF